MFERLRGAIPADHYWRDDVLPVELDRVFRRSWLLVGYSDDLRNHQDFITAQIGPHSIVVQNFKGALKAFRNACSHRGARIQTEPCGNRRLQCPYHNWLYDADGIPRGVPDNDTAFGFSEADKAGLALEAYRLELCGRFVFVCMDNGAPPLRDFLGSVHDDLEYFSSACPDRISSTSVEIDVNWKIGFENAAEGYHVRVIHKETLSPTLGEDLGIDFIGDHSVYYRRLTEETRAWWRRVAKIIRLRTGERFPESTNYIVFPHLVGLATYGASIVLQTYEPIGATRFRCNTTYWLAEGARGPARDAVADDLKALSARIMAEDSGICAGVQAGMREAGQRLSLLGAPENRIAHFQRAYARYMEEAA